MANLEPLAVRSARSCGVCCALLLVVASAIAIAADVPTKESVSDADGNPAQAAIMEQVQKLGSNEFRERERAENVLRERGSTAIEALQQNASHEDLEIRIRVKRLIGELRTQFIREAIPESLKQVFGRYEEQNYTSRKRLLATLADQNMVGRLRLLGRLARFEESELLAKHAALMLLGTDLEKHPGGLEAAQAEIRDGIELSRRVPAEWVRMYAGSYDVDIKQAVESCRKMIGQEEIALQRFEKDTEETVVRSLSRFLVRLMIRGDLREDAMDEIRTLMTRTKPSAVEAMEFLDWLETMKVTELVKEYHEKHEELIDGDAILLYRLAKTYEELDDQAASKDLAEKAFESAGSGVNAHVARFSDLMSLTLARRILQSPGDKAARRFAVARVLDDKIGLMDWAEREYVATIESPVTDVDKTSGEKLPMGRIQGRANISLSELLHDQLREKEAGGCLQQVVDACKESKALLPLLDRPSLGALESRMHYFFACDKAQQEDFEAQREYLTKAIKADPEDVDVLIGMFRSEEAPDDWKADTERRLSAAIKSFEAELRSARATARNANNGQSIYERQVAVLENQYAWLVGNTIGDIDAAIQASQHSLEVYKGEGGYLDTLGRCYYRKGDLESAIRAQTQAVNASPHEFQIRRQLELFQTEAKLKGASSGDDTDEDEDDK